MTTANLSLTAKSLQQGVAHLLGAAKRLSWFKEIRNEEACDGFDDGSGAFRVPVHGRYSGHTGRRTKLRLRLDRSLGRGRGIDGAVALRSAGRLTTCNGWLKPKLGAAGLGALLLTLSACAEPAENTQVAPGQLAASGNAAGTIFAQTCLGTGPQFASLPQAAANLPMTQSPQSGTYFHNTLDISVARTGQGSSGRCSIVFGTAGEPVAEMDDFGRVVRTTAPDREAAVTLRLADQINGRNYIHATIGAQ